jgi:hypothetical protein
MSDKQEANYRGGFDNPQYDRFVTPDWVTDHSSYHAGGQARQQLAGTFKSTGGGVGAVGEAGGSAGLIFIPIFVPPCILFYNTWVRLSSANWEFLPKLPYIVAECAVILYGISTFYRLVPKSVAGIVTAIYMGVAYGMVLNWLNANQTFTACVVIFTGVAGFFMGHSCAAEHEFTPKLTSTKRIIWLSVSIAILWEIALDSNQKYVGGAVNYVQRIYSNNQQRPTYQRYAVVGYSDIYLYIGPGPGYSIIVRVGRGTKVKLIDSSNPNWPMVEIASGDRAFKGYANASYLAPTN